MFCDYIHMVASCCSCTVYVQAASGICDPAWYVSIKRWDFWIWCKSQSYSGAVIASASEIYVLFVPFDTCRKLLQCEAWIHFKQYLICSLVLGSLTKALNIVRRSTIFSTHLGFNCIDTLTSEWFCLAVKTRITMIVGNVSWESLALVSIVMTRFWLLAEDLSWLVRLRYAWEERKNCSIWDGTSVSLNWIHSRADSLRFASSFIAFVALFLSTNSSTSSVTASLLAEKICQQDQPLVLPS